MKRFICIVLCFLFIPLIAFADIDLSTYTLDQLESLRKLVSAEILSRSEWSEVVVHPGFYIVGEDIPAGHWTIKYYNDDTSLIYYFEKPDETGRQPDYYYSYYSADIANQDNNPVLYYSEIDLELKEGYYLTVDIGSVIFSPFNGRQSPFFN